MRLVCYVDQANPAVKVRSWTLWDMRSVEIGSNSLAPFKITVCGIEELGGYCNVGVSHVLSMLDPGWPRPPALGDLGQHNHLELRFHDVIDEATEMAAPRREHVERILDFGHDLGVERRLGAHLLVHCHMGVSRSSAAMMLILAQARPDCPAIDVLAEVCRIRPQAWPNLRIIELGDCALGRNGELIAAAYRLYRAHLVRRPEAVHDLIIGGRRREVEGALGKLP